MKWTDYYVTVREPMTETGFSICLPANQPPSHENDNKNKKPERSTPVTLMRFGAVPLK